MPDMDEYARMGNLIMAKQPFEKGLEYGSYPDTPENRQAFELLKQNIAEMAARGIAPDFVSA
jgi:hypothetical protein